MGPRVLVGRERERAVLLEGLAALTGGRGGLYLLVGEPGIGKTRLAEELGAAAEQQGSTVAWGAAWDGGSAPAYWPWIEVVRALRPLLPEPDRQLRRDLGPLWPEPPRADEERADGAGLEQPTGAHDPELLGFRRFDALRAVVQAAAARKPLVVILEDLHAADRASLQALLLVARSLRRLPVLVLGTHRPADAGAGPDAGEVDQLLAKLGREGTTLPLARLARNEVERLLADKLAGLDPLPARQREELYQASGGNPLFVDESLRLLRTGGRLSQVPAGVGSLIADRLARFEPASRQVLEVAAVLGREVDVGVLADACGLTVAELGDRLRAPRAAGLLEPGGGAGGGERLQFAHGLYRERLIEGVPAERRAALHLRAAEALHKRYAAGHLEVEEALARHLLAAGSNGDRRRAVDSALRAGRGASAALAFDRAVELFEGALAAYEALAEGGPAAAARRMDIELELAEALVRIGAGQRSRALCLAAAEQARAAGDSVRLARAALAYGAELRLAIVDPRLVGLLSEALAALGAGEIGLRAKVMARLAAAQQPAADPQIPVEQARAAIALAGQTGDPATLLTTLHSAGAALVDYTPAEERLPLDRQLVALALARGELTVAHRAYARVAVDCFELGDVGEAEQAIGGHERLGQALGHPRWRWRSPLLRSMRALLLGDWAEAERAQAEAEALVAEADDAGGAATLYVHRAGALRAREAGDPAEVPLFDGPAVRGLAYMAEMVPVIRASMLARLGDVAAARRSLEGLPADLGRFGADPMAIAMLCDAVVGVGDKALARRLLPLLAPYQNRCLSWGVFGLVWEGPAAQFTGTLHALCEEWAHAVPPLEQALALCESISARPLEARIAHDLAWALEGRGHQGDRARAAELIARAARLAEALGMSHLGQRIAMTAARLSAPAVTAATAAPAPGAAPALAVADPGAVTLERDGEVWTIGWQGRQSRLKPARGLDILEQLLRQPGRELHVLALGAGDPGEAIDLGDAGELLDTEARDAYRQRLRDLEQELAEAEVWADAGRRDRLSAEREFLTDELGRAVGLGGRARRAGAAVERARSNVQKRIRAVIRKLGETWPELAAHLDAHVKTGIYVSYRV